MYGHYGNALGARRIPMEVVRPYVPQLLRAQAHGQRYVSVCYTRARALSMSGALSHDFGVALVNVLCPHYPTLFVRNTRPAHV